MNDQHRRNMKAPKPVHPRAMHRHGLLGAAFVNQHMLVDDRWSTEDLIDEFERMTKLLSKRLLFHKLECKDNRERMHEKALRLRKECRDGRIILQEIVSGNNVSEMRNTLMNHKHLQRLYQNMPAHQAIESINQSTFVIRKERDRLTFRLNQLKEVYRLKLIERDDIINRIQYENEFVLNEEKQIFILQKKIENSNVRLKAIKTINSTYKNMIQVLKYDEMFYEPILDSLSSDLDDQANFIKHILYLGLPAIARFKQLREEYASLEDKVRRSVQAKINIISDYRKTEKPTVFYRSSTKDMVVNISKRYQRETRSMTRLRNYLDAVETEIKQLKMATLTSHAKETFPRIKSQIENNLKLMNENKFSHIHHEFLIFKEKAAKELQSILDHGFSKEEERRLQRIKELKEQIKAEDVLEENTLAYIKNRTAAFVVFRCTLWNLWDNLRYVGKTRKILDIKYPNSYLKLPLLNFDMHMMWTVPPEFFEEDLQALQSTIVKKVRLLMKAYDKLTSQVNPNDIGPSNTPGYSKLWDEYHNDVIEVIEDDDMFNITHIHASTQDIQYRPKRRSSVVPDREEIKTQSARIVELSKMNY